MNLNLQVFVVAMVATALTGIATSAHAASFRLLVESNNDLNAGSEVFQASFADFDGLLNSTFVDTGFTNLNIGPQYSIAGLAYDGAYRLLVESDGDQNAGSEVFAATYDTYEDLIAGTISESDFTQLNIGPNFSVGGLAYDGSFQMLVESNNDLNAGSEVFAASFGTFDDLLSSTFADSGFTQLNIGPQFNIAGLAFDGVYRLFVESINDLDAGAEVFAADFLSFNDLIAGTSAGGQFTDINIGPNFSARAFAYERESMAPVPIPAAAWLFASALGVFGYLAKRKAST